MDAAAAGSGDDVPIRGQVRLVGHRRVSHGLYRTIRDDLPPDAEFIRDLEAYGLMLPEGAVFTHVTAARLLGWQLPALPEQVPVFVAVRGEFNPRRPGLICSRLTHPAAGTSCHGLPVEGAEEILLRAARDLGVLDLVIMIDSALAMHHLDRRRLEALLETRRPGVRLLREAYALANPASESGAESLLRVFHEVMQVTVDPQIDLFDDRGRFLGRADLLVRGTTFVHEYDGAHHRSARQHRTDLRRERSWAGTAYQRRGFTLDDLLNHPAVLMHELDRALDRPHRADRLRRWRRLVSDSLYSEPGRARVVNRWRRAWRDADWTGTA